MSAKDGSLPEGCPHKGRVYAWTGGVYAWGVYAWGCLLGMCLPRGVTACHGVSACQGEGVVCLVCPSVQAVFTCQGGVCLVCPGGMSGIHTPCGQNS